MRRGNWHTRWLRPALFLAAASYGLNGAPALAATDGADRARPLGFLLNSDASDGTANPGAAAPTLASPPLPTALSAPVTQSTPKRLFNAAPDPKPTPRQPTVPATLPTTLSAPVTQSAPTRLFNAAPDPTPTARQPASTAPRPAPGALYRAPRTQPQPTRLFNAPSAARTPAAARPAVRPAAAGTRPLGLLFDTTGSPFVPRAGVAPADTAQPQPQPASAPTPAVLNPEPQQRPAAAPDAQPASPVTSGAPAPNEAPGTTGAPEVPVNLTADEMSFDRENGLVSAYGNVEITHGERTLTADRITYNQKTDIVQAAGNITILEPTGEILFADQITITGDLKDGLIHNIGVILADRSRLAAQGAKRSGAVVTELRQGVYSPCNLCADDPEAAPLWQIKAVRVIHDKRSKTIEYRDAWLEFYGIPVMYTPYFAHPDPSIQRKAGFLAPGFGGSSDLGFVTRLPYFYPIDDSSDVTATPALSESEGFQLTLDYRKRFKNGKLDAQVSGINDSEGDFRGHVFSEGLWDINRTWRAGFDINRATDDTYLRRFGFDSPSVLESRVFAEGFRGRNYLAVNAYSFQDQRADADSIDSPFVLPLVEFSHVGEPDRFGGNFNVDASFLVVSRDDSGNDTRRISLRPSWNRRFSDPIGNLFGFSAGIWADAYHVDNVSRDNGTSFTGVTGRMYPYVSLDWRFPLISTLGKAHQTLEPIVNVVMSPNGGNPEEIPNEDSQEFEFDDTNLFGVNRFGGVDRVEGGTRVNYGVKWGLLGPTGRGLSLLVGQTYRFHTDDTFSEGSGLEDDLSDIVATARINPSEYFDLGYRTQFAKDGFSPRRHQVQLSAGVPLLRASTSYIFFEEPEDSEFSGREELTLGLASQFTREWRVNFQAVRDMAADEMRSLVSDLVFENECLVVTARLSRTFYEDRDLQPTDAFTINLLLKTLGQITF
jgi:LPS-assembly protein